MGKVYQAEYAGHLVRYTFLHPYTRQHFKFWLHPVEGEDYEIKATPELVARVLANMPEGNPEYYAEYKSLITLTSEYLLQFGCCLYHAVAFFWRGRSWLLTAPSGTGKTTQFMNWRRLHPGEITMICGDMPVLELRSDGSVWVHSSNWNGKEGVGNKISAPLGGVILLEQGKENRIAPLPVRDAIAPLLCQFAVAFDTEEKIRSVCKLLDGVLCSYPVWKFVNLGDAASTELLRRTIAERIGGENETV